MATMMTSEPIVMVEKTSGTKVVTFKDWEEVLNYACETLANDVGYEYLGGMIGEIMLELGPKEEEEL